MAKSRALVSAGDALAFMAGQMIRYAAVTAPAGYAEELRDRLMTWNKLRAAGPPIPPNEQAVALLERYLAEREEHLVANADPDVVREAFMLTCDRIAVSDSPEWVRLWDAVVAIWTHTEKHTTYVPDRGYVWHSGDPPCHDIVEHSRLAAEEGAAWHAYRAGIPQ